MAIHGFAGSKPAMSRISRKSELSPSVTKSGGGIDLGKNDVDMGSKGKTSPSVTSGGIGVSTEITNVGGLTVTGGVSVDISPIDLGINYDPSENSLGIAGGAEIPGGLLGASGGITVDLDTGEVIGGQVGGEALGLGVNISASKDGGLGVEFTVQIPFTPIELSLGFGFSPKKGKSEPSAPSEDINKDSKGFGPNKSKWPSFKPNCYYIMVMVLLSREEVHENCLGYGSGDGSFGYSFEKIYKIDSYSQVMTGFTYNDYYRSYEATIKEKEVLGSVFSRQAGWLYVVKGDLLDRSASPNGGSGVEEGITIVRRGGFEKTTVQGMGNTDWGQAFQQTLDFYNNGRQDYTSYAFIPLESCPNEPPNTPILDNSNSSGSSGSSGSSPPSPFPNPPPRKQNKMDDCCKLNLKFLRAIYTGLGIAKFPGRLPSTIVQEVPKEGEQPAEPSQVPINDFVDLLNWQFERDDERWGQWEIQIDIKDSDITKEGDQKKPIKFPNLAESVAELEGQILSIMTNVDALVALQIKNLAESGMARQEAIKGYLASKAIIKYMAFKSSETDVPVPMTFTAGAETISELLKESEGHIKGTDYTEKETLRDVYLDLLQAAAIIRAVHWQRIDTKSDPKSQLLNILKGSVDLATSIAKPPKSNGDGQEQTFSPEKDFEDFIDAVEDGFRNTTGVTDIQNPYGKSPDRRPRIRQIGDNIDQAGKGN
jgi:hypothetical protein